MPQIRLLPVTIFVAVLMLSVKVNDIWRGISLTSQSRAQQASTPAQRPGQPASAQPAQPAGQAQQQSQAGSAPPAASGARPASAPPVVPATRSSAPILTTPSPDGTEATFTQTEIDVLQKLSARRSELEGRAKEIDGREALLKAAESRIDKKITEMKTLQGTIEGLLKQYNDQEDTKMKSLVKIYENMKPKEAAKIFEQLDMPIMLDVIERMKETKVAPIMAEMDPSKAKSLTSELAHRRQIPVPRSQ
jgi:flagellar motility protein MotE (MotC chaperone)